jgi:hypothetical protein
MPKYYRLTAPDDVRDLSDQMALWLAADNPKASQWAAQPPAPSATAVWQDGGWVTPEAPSPIVLGERAVEAAGLTASRLVTLIDLLLRVQAGETLGEHPKLVALYDWLQTVKSLALAGVTEFPAAPHTFEEVVAE